MRTKYNKQAQDAIETIRQHPGITQAELAKTIEAVHGIDRVAATGIVSALAQANAIVRVRSKLDGSFTYMCYTTVPPGVNPELFKAKVKRTKVECAAAAAAQPESVTAAAVRPAPVLTVGEDLFANAPPAAATPATVMPTTAAEPKPAARLVLEMPDGSVVTIPTRHSREVLRSLQQMYA